jgi:hypothetical protein
VQVFHAGTSASEDGSIRATGGRVLAVTALADSVQTAQQKAYKVLHAPLLAAESSHLPRATSRKLQACCFSWVLPAVIE